MQVCRERQPMCERPLCIILAKGPSSAQRQFCKGRARGSSPQEGLRSPLSCGWGISEGEEDPEPRLLQWNPNWQRCRFPLPLWSPPFLCPLMFTLGLLGLGSVGLRVQESPSVLCSSPAPSLTPGLSSRSKELHSGL